MSEQPEALRLADVIDSDFDPDWMLEEGYDQITAELRRLHTVNQNLLNALHSISLASQDSGSTREGMGLYARAAIAKSERNT